MKNITTDERKIMKLRFKTWIELDFNWAPNGTIPCTKGCLFDDFFANIHTESVGQGGSWEKSVADADEIKFLYEKLGEFESPVMLDIGANTGSFCLLPSVNPKIKCYAFEPTPWIFDLLKINISLNDLQDQVELFQIALTEKNGTAILKCPAEGDNKGHINICNSGLSCLGKPMRFDSWIEIEVPTRTLDSIVADKDIKHVDIMKIDVEGCELFVLKGAEKLIKEQHPGILIDATDNTQQFSYDKADISELLQSWGYENKVEVVKGSYYLWSD